MLTTKAHAEVFAGREFPFTPRDFREIAAILHREAGIALAEIKAPLVYSRLVKRLRKLGIESFKHYCALVESEHGADERGNMVAALTTNVTRFFREMHHFDHLKLNVLPELIPAIREGIPLRIWSAGCASGEEPYSIALTVLSVMPDAARFNVRILATDINKNVLAIAERGVYSDTAVTPIPRMQRAQWFAPTRNKEGRKSWRVGEELRSLVTFRQLNLMDSWPMKRAYHAIFCRNVAIYFPDESHEQIWTRLAALLAPRGCLYVGHSERVNAITDKFQLEGCTTYRLKGG
jgi:chemotaxis protein methyltransferase CheR